MTKYITNASVKISISNATFTCIHTEYGGLKLFNIIYNSTNIFLDIYDYSSPPTVTKLYTKNINSTSRTWMTVATYDYFCVRNITHIILFNYNFTSNP